MDNANAEAGPDGLSTDSPGSKQAPELNLKLHAERLNVVRTKRTRVVRASSVTSLRAERVEEELASERIDVVCIPIWRHVDVCPPVRIEGDTTILSIVEEVLVVERRLILREEVHMTKVRETKVHCETVTLREQHLVVTREEID